MTYSRWFTRTIAALLLAALFSILFSSCTTLSKFSPNRTKSIDSEIPDELKPYQAAFHKTKKKLLRGKICATLSDEDLAPFRDPGTVFEPPEAENIGDRHPSCVWNLGYGHTYIEVSLIPTLVPPHIYEEAAIGMGEKKDRFAHSDRYLDLKWMAEKPWMCFMTLIPDGIPDGVSLSVTVSDYSHNKFFENQYDPTYGVCNVLATPIEKAIAKLGWKD